MGIPVIHMRGAGVGFGTRRSGGFFFIWTLLALGVTAFFSVILSVRGLWSLRRGQPPSSPTTRTWKGLSHGGGDRRGSSSAGDRRA
jgi:hypothetical protein